MAKVVIFMDGDIDGLEDDTYYVARSCLKFFSLR